MKREETAHHFIDSDKESGIPFDPCGIVGSVTGLEFDHVRITDRDTGAVGEAVGNTRQEAEDKAWRELRSENEAQKPERG